MTATPRSSEKVTTALILAGGTGGHVYPALAVAQTLREIGWRVHWLGSSGGMEGRLVPAAGIPLHEVRVSGLRGKGWSRRLLGPWMLLRALGESLRTVRRLQPSMVLGMGGFVAGPAGIAAWLLRKPLVVHEQNAVPGLTNRLLVPFARRVLEAFPGSFARLGKARGAKVFHTGNPLRREIVAVERGPSTHAGPGRDGPKGEQTDDERPGSVPARTQIEQQAPLRVLVLGGSQGASALNELVPQALVHLRTRLGEGSVAVTHQCGTRNEDRARAIYEGLPGVEVVAFIEDMAKAYANAELVVARAGAMTVCELAAVGVPSLLIPYPFAVDDHQRVNAEYLADAGAARVLPQAELDAEGLAAAIAELVENPERLSSMAVAARGQGIRDATERVVAHCREVANG